MAAQTLSDTLVDNIVEVEVKLLCVKLINMVAESFPDELVDKLAKE